MPPNRPIAGATGSAMASRGNRPEARRPQVRLYVATPPLADSAGPAAALSAALDAENRAAAATSAQDRHDYEALAKSWRMLARSFEFAERLQRFLLDTPPH